MTTVTRDSGSASLEVALLCPALAVLAAVLVQVALWMHAQNVTEAAAQQGVRALAVADGGPQQAELRAQQYAAVLGGDLLAEVAVTARRDGPAGVVVVQARVASIVPGWQPTVTRRAQRHLEQPA